MIFIDRNTLSSHRWVGNKHHEEWWNNSVISSPCYLLNHWSMEDVRTCYGELESFSLYWYQLLCILVDLRGQILHPNPRAWFEIFHVDASLCCPLSKTIRHLQYIDCIPKGHHIIYSWVIVRCPLQLLEIISIDDVQLRRIVSTSIWCANI